MIRSATLIAATAALALAPSAGAWTSVTHAGRSTDEAGLVRTSDDDLHVAALEHHGAADSLVERTLDRDGRLRPGASPIASGWADLTAAELLAGPAGTQAVFAGQRTTDPADPLAQGRVVTATRTTAGWALGAPLSALPGPAYASDRVAARVDAAGVLQTSWATADGVQAHAGTDPQVANAGLLTGCCGYGPALAGTTAGLVAAWYQNPKGAQGIRVRLPDGSQRFAPGSHAARTLPVDERVGLAERAGSAWLAYGTGYPSYGRIVLWRVGADEPALAVRAPGAQHVELAPGPGGRLWLLWSQDGALRAARTNPAVTRLGAVVRVRSATAIDRLAGDGATGPLDVIATRGNGTDHVRVLPGLTLVRHRRSYRVLDAGRRVRGARITVGRRVVGARMPGYTPARLRRVRP